MPPNNTPMTQQPNARKPAERIVPVIPLALSKPKPTKRPRQEADVKAGTENSTVHPEEVKELDSQQEQTVTVANGDDGEQVNGVAVSSGLVMDGPVTMPTVDTPPSRGSAAMSLSFGGTPEIPTADSSRPASPPLGSSQSPARAASQASSQNQSDRFDLRQIRTELPPAFIPSAEQHTPKSATSSNSTRPTNSYPQNQPQRPLNGNIVFGGQDPSASSPTALQSTGSAFTSPPYPAFGTNNQPFFVPQHAHHTSEPPFRQHQPTYPYGQSSGGWHNRQGYAQPISHAPPFHPHAHAPFRYPPRDFFTPGVTSPQANGHASTSRSPSHASSATRDQRRPAKTDQSPLSPTTPVESRVPFTGQPHPRQQQFHQQMGPPSQHPDVAVSIANAEALREHILESFSNSSFADCQLIITDGQEADRSLKCHRLIISRSPTLLNLLHDTAAPATGTAMGTVPVQLQGPYLRSSTLIDAIRYLYGERLLRYDYLRPNSVVGDHIPSNLERMENALRMIATGAWLKMGPIAHRGAEVAAGLLHWETVSSALAFALDGGLSPVWNQQDGIEDRASVSSSDESLSRAEPATSPTYDPYSTHLLTRIAEFIVHFFPISFYLDAAAAQLASSPHLPTIPATHESRPSRSDPRLSQIRFGDIPVDDHQRPSFATTTVSSILLSLPFQILKFVLESPELGARLGHDTVASIMRQVIAERETRRTKVLNSATAALLNDTSDTSLVQNLYWEESVETSTRHGAGFRLTRRKRDIDTPPSSGACSERNK